MTPETLMWPGFLGVGGLESGGDLSLLVLVLVFAGCEHVQGAVASSCVVPDLDVVVDRARELDAGLPSFSVQQLDLHAGPERLDHRIVERSADGTDGWCEAGFCDLLAEDPGSELNALIGMNDSSLSRRPAIQGHAEGVRHEQAGLAAVDRPAHDHA